MLLFIATQLSAGNDVKNNNVYSVIVIVKGQKDEKKLILQRNAHKAPTGL